MALLNTAIILAGGKSTRMGFDKQLLNIEGINITTYIIQVLKTIFKDIIIVTNKPDLYKNESVILTEDYYKDCGPLGGIHAGLMSSRSMYNYFIACDMPYINVKYIKFMMKKIAEDDYKTDGVITKFGEWIEPFNAFYSRRLIPLIEENIESDKRKISELFHSSDIMYIEERVARGFSPDWRMFTNLNTEEDLKEIIKQKNRRVII